MHTGGRRACPRQRRVFRNTIEPPECAAVSFAAARVHASFLGITRVDHFPLGSFFRRSLLSWTHNVYSGCRGCRRELGHHGKRNKRRRHAWRCRARGRARKYFVLPGHSSSGAHSDATRRYFPANTTTDDSARFQDPTVSFFYASRVDPSPRRLEPRLGFLRRMQLCSWRPKLRAVVCQATWVDWALEPSCHQASSSCSASSSS